jgi:predicted nucleic acid-binding protein
LDANALVAITDATAPVAHRIRQSLAADSPLQVSAMAWAEFQNGPSGGLSAALDQAARQVVSAILPITEKHAELAATLFNATGRRSRSLPDCLVAACAIQAKAPLITVNRVDFLPFIVHGLCLE